MRHLTVIVHRKWLTVKRAAIVAGSCLVCSLLVFGWPQAPVVPILALLLVAVVSCALSPRLLFPHAWPSFHLTAIVVASTAYGFSMAVPIAFVSAIAASFLRRAGEKHSRQLITLAAHAAGPSLRSLVGAAAAQFITPLIFAAPTAINQIIVFSAGWYLLVLIQLTAFELPARNADLDARITNMGVILMDGISNLLASLTVASAFSTSDWAAPLFLTLPILAIYLVTAHEAESERRLWEGVITLHRVLLPNHPSSVRHMQRVAEYGRQTALALGFSESQADLVNIAAVVHDIGKLAIDERILEKPTKLTSDEMNHVRKHAEIGSDILATVPAYLPIAKWVRHHHERVDGAGYPDGLKGDSIPIESRIIAVVDAYDAMVGGPDPGDRRPYKEPMSAPEALEELRRCSGTQFDPVIVDAFCRITTESDGVAS